MAVSQLPQAPYRQDRRIYPTPDSGDVLFSEVRDCTRSEIPEYGTPHPNTKKWPDHKLVYVKPVDIERDGIFEFFYAADRENQDLYNFSVGYRNIIGNAGGREFRVVQRSYVTPRADFQPLDIPFGTPMPNVPEGKFDDIEYVFFDRQQQPIDQQELNSLYVAEVHTYVEKAFLDEKLSYTAQRNDPLPEKFQILVPEQVVEQIVEGKAEMPILTGSELSVKEDQLNPDVKLVRTATRDRSTLPISLNQKATTNEKQLATVTETVQSGDTVEEPSATVDIESQALGDGSYVVRKTEVPELFTAGSYSVERPDLVPEKFRAAVPTTTEETSTIGTAESPELIAGELAATEQQQNKFVKRTRKTKRDVTTYPKSLSQKATASDKQVATITETLQVGDTTEASSATVDIESQALGDGTYVVRKTEVPELFTAPSYSVERPDLVPEKFRAVAPTTTEEVSEIGEAANPKLSTGELAVTEQQQNKFVKRTRKTKRDVTTYPQSLSQKATSSDKQVATITETLQVGDTKEASSATVDIESQALGDGTYVVRKTEVPELFTAPAYSIERPDLVPEKFRAALPTTTEEVSSVGTAKTPQLSTGELAATEQQQNKFVKRTRKTKRDTTSYPRSLTQKATTPDKQVAVVTETLQVGDTKEVSSATVDIESQALGDGTYIVRKIETPEIFASPSYSIERPDLVPEKFRAALPTTTEELTEAGTASAPKLGVGELAAVEQQQNKFVKRSRKTKRDTTSYPQSLSQKATTPDKQVATVTETLQVGDTKDVSSATVDIESQALGDGTYIVRKIETPELFTAESYSVERPDLVPEKFRAAIPTITEESSSVGVAQAPILATGEIAAAEQQQNKFVKRTRKTKRDTTSYPKSLTQKATTPNKQVATVTETIQVGDTVDKPSATVDIESQALGDGTYVVRKVEVPKLFEEKSVSIEKPDIVPEKFKSTIPTIVEASTKAGQIPTAKLGAGEISKSYQQVNDFTYREQVVSRDGVAEVTMPSVKRAYVEGTIANVNEKLTSSPQVKSGLNVAESSVTALGNNQFVVQTVEVDEWPELKSSEWDYELNTQIQKTEQFVAPPTSFNEPYVSYKAINQDRSLKIKEVVPTSALSDYTMSFPTQIDIRLPDILKSLQVVWSEDSAIGYYDSEWDGAAGGESNSLSGAENASTESSASVKPELLIEIERPWGSDISATAYFFFIKTSDNSVSESSFLTRLSVVSGLSSIKRWPTFKPVSHTVVLNGSNGGVQAKVNWSASNSQSNSGYAWDKTVGKGASFNIGKSLNAITIPPVIHGNISISGQTSRDLEVSATASSTTGGTYGGFPFVGAALKATHKFSASVTPTSFSGTSPTNIPRSGYYVVQSQVIPYKWGWAKCSATVINASIFA